MKKSLPVPHNRNQIITGAVSIWQRGCFRSLSQLEFLSSRAELAGLVLLGTVKPPHCPRPRPSGMRPEQTLAFHASSFPLPCGGKKKNQSSSSPKKMRAGLIVIRKMFLLKKATEGSGGVAGSVGGGSSRFPPAAGGHTGLSEAQGQVVALLRKRIQMLEWFDFLEAWQRTKESVPRPLLAGRRTCLLSVLGLPEGADGLPFPLWRYPRPHGVPLQVTEHLPRLEAKTDRKGVSEG